MLVDLKPYQKRDIKRGTPGLQVLSNWGVLHAHLAERQKHPEGLTPDYVIHLLRIELATRKRLVLATRLLGVYHRLAREENERRLAEALGDK